MFIPYIILEEYYKKKQIEDNKNKNDFYNYLCEYFKQCDVQYYDFYGVYFQLNLWFGNLDSSHHSIKFNKDGEIIRFYPKYGETGEKEVYKFEKDEKAKKIVKDFVIRYMKYYGQKRSYKLNASNDTNKYEIEIDITFADKLKFLIKSKGCDLYLKMINENLEEKEQYDKRILEEKIGQLLASLKVDISKLPQEEQEEINQYYISRIGQLNEKQEIKLKEFRQKQIDRIMLAYQKFKEITELLNDTKMDLDFDKIKIENLRNIIFKNNGYPTEKGYIEFEDFFKNNMILRMIDLSELDLSNVNITYMDFSGTNVHIDPQTIYNKDMTGVNATGIHFSPFKDSFDDVILDGAIINDYEAMVDLDKLKSYSDTTVIKKEVVSKFSTR